MRAIVIELSIMLGVSVVLAALGPFGSFAMGDYGARLAYWLPASLLGYAVFRPSYLGGIVAARRLHFSKAAGAAAGVALGAIPACLLIFLLSGRRFEDLSNSNWFQFYLQVAIIGALVATLFALLERRAVAPSAHAGPATHASAEEQIVRPLFLDRLPPDIAVDLVALEMEDHYVRAHAPGRSALILMRMRDAERELEGIDGMRVHRSWWVARTAVEQLLRDGRSIKLQLRGGIEAPVARDRLPALRAAGWTD